MLFSVFLFHELVEWLYFFRCPDKIRVDVTEFATALSAVSILLLVLRP